MTDVSKGELLELASKVVKAIDDFNDKGLTICKNGRPFTVDKDFFHCLEGKNTTIPHPEGRSTLLCYPMRESNKANMEALMWIVNRVEQGMVYPILDIEVRSKNSIKRHKELALIELKRLKLIIERAEEKILADPVQQAYSTVIFQLHSELGDKKPYYQELLKKGI